MAMGSEHLSCYEVIYEEDTALYRQLQAGKFQEDEDLACAMYEELLERAGEAGFYQYEVANFAREGNGRRSLTSSPKMVPRATGLPGFACRHNVNYWQGGHFYGLGPSATSYVCGVRTRNWANTEIYCEQLERGKRAIESSEELSPLARAGETAAFGLRLVKGWQFEQFQALTGYDLRREWEGEMARLSRQGW